MRGKIIALLALTAAMAFAGGCSCVSESAPVASCPPPSAEKGAKAPSGEVRGDVAYRLGDGVIANSTSIVMAGGYSRPRPFELPGGMVVVACRPGTWTPNAPIAAAVAEPFAADAYCPAPSSGIDTEGVFTLTEEELRNGPEIVDVASLRNGPMEAGAKPEAPVAASIRPPAAEEPKPEPVAVAAVVAEPDPIVPPQLPEVRIDKYAHVRQPLPPIPTVADLEGAVEALLSSESAAASSLPSVELPPRLN